MSLAIVTEDILKEFRNSSGKRKAGCYVALGAALITAGLIVFGSTHSPSEKRNPSQQVTKNTGTQATLMPKP